MQGIADWQAESMRIWEKQNAPDPYEEQMKTASASLSNAISGLKQAIRWINTACNDLGDSPMGDKLMWYLESIEDYKIELKGFKEKWEKGVRE